MEMKMLQLIAQKNVLQAMIDRLEKQWDDITDEIYENRQKIRALFVSMESYDEEKDDLYTKNQYKLMGKRQGINQCISELYDELGEIDSEILSLKIVMATL